MRILAWTLFHVSLLGLLMSALLRSPPVRDTILRVFFRIDDEVLHWRPNAVRDLLEAAVGALYRNPQGRLSWRKLLLLSGVAALAWTVVAVRVVPPDPAVFVNTTTKWLAVGAVALALLPSFFLYEYWQARWLLRTVNRQRERSPSSLAFEIFSLYGVWFWIAIGVSAVVGWLKPPGYSFLLTTPFMGPALPLLAAMTDSPLPHWSLVLPFTLTYLNGLVLITLVAAIVYSRRLLRSVAHLVATLADLHYERTFRASLVLLTLATGLMQALEFANG